MRLATFRPYAAFNPPPLPLPTSAYIHLPFCMQKCAYCAFPVIVTPAARSSLQTPAIPELHQTYAELLRREISAVSSLRPSKAPIHTLYLGGGTPSLLHPTLLESILRTLKTYLPLSPNAEITAEMDPATFDYSTALAFAQLGVNRASVGAQSFDDSVLSLCKRVHKSTHIYTAVDTLRAAGIDNISLDLISALPTQTLQSWRHSLTEAISLAPNHISAYDLTIEPGTPFERDFTPGKSPLPEEDTAAEMMLVASAALAEAGYEHYEISNYARRSSESHGFQNGPASPFRSRHNMAYWRNSPFYAFGLGATSLTDGVRFARPRRLSQYTKYVADLERSCDGMESILPDKHEHHVMKSLYPNVSPQSPRERLEDFLLNSFRLLVEGVRFAEVEQYFGAQARQRLHHAVKKCERYISGGFMEVVEREGHECLRLTEKGALIENEVLSSLMQEAIWRFPADGGSNNQAPRCHIHAPVN